ncbi:MAG: tRNA (adenosine(37)-N6)-threonylcarbamoyltransferase complex dimerization subunit type 1 TsaB [Muribaculaceae bacterium]|nr:tRNA (adenosine(37)-N6)-threonylcarbamoyltransferase complex dimerization subunit type 1 TsaB [Muribaculaceae bacterium]
MTTILNIETSDKCCSAAVCCEGEVLFEKREPEGMNHARLLAPFVQECMDFLARRELKLDAVGVSIGPGSYTGLRIGLSMAKGLCYGKDLPLIGVPTLQIMAVQAMFASFDWQGDELLIPMLDARRMEVYTATYDFALNEVQPVRPLILEADSFNELISQGKKLIFIGPGAIKAEPLYKELTGVEFRTKIVPDARGMMALSDKFFREGRFLDIAYSVPEYLKEFQATVPKNKVLG